MGRRSAARRREPVVEPRESTTRSRVLILDFGSQYNQLIARRVREQGVYSEIHPYDWPLDRIRAFGPGAIILSGGPGSVLGEEPMLPAEGILDLGVPILGICYGMQVVSHLLGGEVSPSHSREYGRSNLEFDPGSRLFHGATAPFQAWMSHGDSVARLPANMRPMARTDDCPYAAAGDEDRRIYLLQFHPEVAHTPQGASLIRSFLFTIAGLDADWSMEAFVDRATRDIRARVGRDGVLCALSGGVDSSVTATLVHRAIGDQLGCIFVDTGLLRKNEGVEVMELLARHEHLNIRRVDAGARFLEKLRGVEDPEEKRRVIGREFIAVFEDEARTIPNVRYLAQGTLYPDVIESVSTRGPSATIKTHHNVGGLPERMCLALIEPLRELFKDEVREVGRVLHLPERLLGRHPFPGPGLAVRILGDVTAERVRVLQEADAVFIEELRRQGLYDAIWQAFAVLLPVRSVGVMGDMRTYENVVALRAVTSTDGMTADWAEIPRAVLSRVANRIVNEVPGVNRVVYDISSKPPATIEWE
jgi:GMP synthase (glutamine-hydrolysing)